MSTALKIFSIFRRDTLLFVVNMATGVLVARTLGPAIFGVWVILTLLPSYAEVLGRTKSDLAAVYHIGKKTFQHEDVLFNLNLIAIASSTLIITLFYWQFDLIYDWLFEKEAGDYRQALKVLMMIVPLQFLYLNYSYFHVAQENIYAYNRMTIAQAVLYSIVSVFLLTLTPLGLWSLIIAKLIGMGGALIYGWSAVDRQKWEKGEFHSEIIVVLLKYGFSFYLSGVFSQLQQSGVRLLGVSYLAPAQMAFLSQGQIMSSLLQRLVDPISTVLYPRISHSDKNIAAEISCKAFRVSMILTSIGFFILLVIADPLIVLLYGSNFQPSANVMQLLLLGVAINGVASTLSGYFKGVGIARILPYLMVGPIMLQFFLAWLFMPEWGLYGAVLAISIGQAAHGIILILSFSRISSSSLSKLIPTSTDTRFIYNFVLNKLKS